MDRDVMLAAWATCITDGKEKPELAIPQPMVSYDAEVERERLELEKRKFEAELQLEQAEIKTQERLKIAEIESQEKLKHAELKLRQEKLATEREEKESVVNLAKPMAMQ